MDVREKLVELANDVLRYLPWGEIQKDTAERIADRMMDHGVTVQEFGGCEYCKEDSEGCRKMFGAFSITNPFHGKEWFINTGHCKPRQICFCPMCGRRLPQPPKGE
jgi:hypothetical protein